MVIKVLILTHYKQGVKTIVETDLSDYVSSRVLPQLVKIDYYTPLHFFLKISTPLNVIIRSIIRNYLPLLDALNSRDLN